MKFLDYNGLKRLVENIKSLLKPIEDSIPVTHSVTLNIKTNTFTTGSTNAVKVGDIISISTNSSYDFATGTVLGKDSHSIWLYTVPSDELNKPYIWRITSYTTPWVLTKQIPLFTDDDVASLENSLKTRVANFNGVPTVFYGKAAVVNIMGTNVTGPTSSGVTSVTWAPTVGSDVTDDKYLGCYFKSAESYSGSSNVWRYADPVTKKWVNQQPPSGSVINVGKTDGVYFVVGSDIKKLSTTNIS